MESLASEAPVPLRTHVAATLAVVAVGLTCVAVALLDRTNDVDGFVNSFGFVDSSHLRFERWARLLGAFATLQLFATLFALSLGGVGSSMRTMLVVANLPTFSFGVALFFEPELWKRTTSICGITAVSLALMGSFFGLVGALITSCERVEQRLAPRRPSSTIIAGAALPIVALIAFPIGWFANTPNFNGKTPAFSAVGMALTLALAVPVAERTRWWVATLLAVPGAFLCEAGQRWGSVVDRNFAASLARFLQTKMKIEGLPRLTVALAAAILLQEIGRRVNRLARVIGASCGVLILWSPLHAWPGYTPTPLTILGAIALGSAPAVATIVAEKLTRHLEPSEA